MDFFNLGFPKSGTSSLQYFFEQVKIISSHWTVASVESGSARKHKYVGQAMYANYMNGKKIFSGFSNTKAITQADVCLPVQGLNLWPQFDESIRAKILHQYPDIKFVLLKRDPRLIVTSIKCWNDMFFRFVVSDIPGLPAWRGLKDDELLAWVEGHYFSIESQYTGIDNFISLDINDPGSFDQFLEFSGLGDAASAASISEWPKTNVSKNDIKFDSSLYWLASDLSAEVKRGNALQIQLNELRQKFSVEKDDGHKVVSQLKQNLTTKTVELESERKEKSAFAERVNVLEAELAGVKGEHVARLKEKKHLKVQLEELKQTVTAKSAELEVERKESESLAERVKALEVELVDVKNNRDIRAQEHKDLQSKVQVFKKNISAKRAELEVERKESLSLAERVKTLEVELASVKNERDLRAKEKKNLQGKIEDLKTNLSTKRTELDVERMQRVSGAERVKTLESKLEPLQHELSSLAAVLERVQKSRDDHAKSRFDLAQQVNQLKNELNVKVEALQMTSKQVDISKERVTSLEQELKSVTDEMNSLAHEKDSFRREAEVTLLQLHQVQEELEKIFMADQAKANDLQLLNDKNSELEQAILVNKDVLSQVGALKGEIKWWKNQRDQLRNDVAEAQQNADELKRQLIEKDVVFEKAQQNTDDLNQQLLERDAGLEKARQDSLDQAMRFKELESKLAWFKKDRNEKVSAERDNSELLKLQLAQVQQELERYYLNSRSQDDLLRQHQAQNLSMRKIISSFVTKRF